MSATVEVWTAAVLLVVQLAALVWFVNGDLTALPLFRGLADGRAGARRYWRWTVKDLVGFALPVGTGLLLLGRLDAVATVPAEFGPARTLLPQVGLRELGPLAASAGLGMSVGTVLVVIVTRWRRLKKPFGTVGDVEMLLPRGRGELLPAAVLSISAGVTEELTFRLYLPLLLAILTGSAVVAFGIATLIFGAVHRYQGWAGVVATAAVGAAMAAVYLMTGMLWLAMALHTAIDLNALVIRPLLTGTWRGPRAAL